jgi:hypothetical protein
MRKILTPQLQYAIEAVVDHFAHDEHIHWLGGVERDHIWHALRYLQQWLDEHKLKELSESKRLSIELELSHQSQMLAIADEDLTRNDIAVAEVTEAAAARIEG